MNLPLSHLKDLKACDLSARIATFTAHYGRPPDEAATVAEWLAVTHALADRLWVVCYVLLPALPDQEAVIRRACQEMALIAAEAALPIWEATYPDDARPRRAIEAARAYLDNPSEEAREALRTAVDAADAANAAATAWAAAAAANAAYAVDAAWTAAASANRSGADLAAAHARLDELFRALGVVGAK